MKKNILTLALAAMLLIPSVMMASPTMSESIFTNFFSLEDFHTYDYASWVHFSHNTFFGSAPGAYIGTGYGYDDELSWGHTLPAGLSVPPDVITRARLWIDGAQIDSHNNEVAIEGVFDWDPLNHHFLDNSVFNLTNIDTPGFWNDGILDVSIFAGECNLRIDNAVLMLDYSSGGNNVPGAVPEPATLALFGLGMLGMGILRRKKA